MIRNPILKIKSTNPYLKENLQLNIRRKICERIFAKKSAKRTVQNNFERQSQKLLESEFTAGSSGKKIREKICEKNPRKNI